MATRQKPADDSRDVELLDQLARARGARRPDRSPHHRPAQNRRRSRRRAARRRSRAARRRPRPRQDAARADGRRRRSTLSFSRVQFTPDLMPSDITGTELLEEDHATGRRVLQVCERPDLRQRRARRRDQPRPAEDAGRAAPGDAGARGHRGRPDASRCPSRSSCSPRRTRSSRKARIRCPKRSSIAS